MCAFASGKRSLLMSGMGEQPAHLDARELLERLGVGHDVHAAAHEQVAHRGARRRVARHLVDADLLCPRAALEEEVVQHVHLQVPRGDHVGAAPRVALRVHRHRRLRRVVEVLVQARVDAVGERRLARVAAARRAPGEHEVDRVGEHLDVPELLGGDVRHEVVEGRISFRPRKLNDWKV
jgi:hypothetical protein